MISQLHVCINIFNAQSVSNVRRC